MNRPSNISEVVEYLTFGRRPRLLFRVWLLQIVVVFFEVQALQGVHPDVKRRVGESFITSGYVVVFFAALAVLAVFLRRMSRLTFAPTLRRPLHVGVSMLSYLLVGGGVVVPLVSVPGIEPSLSELTSMPELSLVLMVTATLAALLAVGFYALFDLEDSPSRSEMWNTIGDWIQFLDWVDKPEGSREKRDRYAAFREQTAELSRLLDYAVTGEGKQLQADFEDWLDSYADQSLLSQEVIVRGDVRNARLERQHEKLARLVERFERIRE